MEEYNSDNYYVVGESTNDVIIKACIRMFLGLMVTGVVAYYMFTSGAYIRILTGFSYGILGIMEIAVVLIFSLAFRKLSPTMVTVLFYLYAFINGITMSVIFAAFEINTIFYAFFMTAILFGALAVYGYTTKRDMTKFGTIFTVGLIVGLIFSVINIFIGSTTLDLIIDWAMLLLFCGITIYDINKIPVLKNSITDPEKLYIYVAMDLYLDFINIFIRLLSILGRNKRN